MVKVIRIGILATFFLWAATTTALNAMAGTTVSSYQSTATDGTPPHFSAHGFQMQELPPPSKIPSEDDQEAAALAAKGLLFPKPGAAGPQLQSATPDVSPNFIVFGYLQSEAMVYHIRWQALTHVGSLFVDFDNTGSLTTLSNWTGRSSYLKAGGAAQAAGVKVVMVVRNASFNETTLNTVMQSASLRQTLANNVISAVTSDSYCAGVSFDLEFSWGTATRDGITAFLSYLRANLPSQYEISVYTGAIYSSTQWDIPGIEPNIDYLLYSTYDWATGLTPHAISDFNNDLPYIAAYLNAGLPANKMVLVWAAYARRWAGTTSYGSAGTSSASRGFTDGLYDTTLNPNYGGPYADNYVTGDEVDWYTYNNGSTDYTVTWDSPAAMEYKLRNSLIFPGSGGSHAGVRLRGVGFWSLAWMAADFIGGFNSYNGNATDPPTGSVARTRTYPQIYQLCQEIFAPPGTTKHVFDGFEGLDYRWRDPNASPDTVGDTDGDSSRLIVTAPAGTGRPPNTTNAMQVTFDFEGATNNRIFFRYEVLADDSATTAIDTNATCAHFDANTKVSAYVYTPSAYSGYTVRMVALDANRQLEASNPYTLNASGWRQIQWDLTDPAQINGYTTSEWAFNSGDGVLDTAGGGAKDISFEGFLIEGNGATVNDTVDFDELTYEHANPGGKNYTINEFRYNGVDKEFVEIYGPAGAFPAGFEIRLMRGDNSTPTVISLAGQSMPDDGGGYGYFVVGDSDTPNVDYSTGFSTTVDDIPDVSPGAIQLYDTATGCVYDSTMYRAMGGLGTLARPFSLGVTDNGYPWIGEGGPGSNASGTVYTLGRYPDGANTHVNSADFSAMPATPGAANGNSITLPVSYNFTTAPPNAFQTYQSFVIADPTAAGLPASPGGGNAHRCVDVSGGGVMSFFGDASLGAGDAGYTASGEIYIPTSSEPAQANAIGLCGRQGSTFFTSSTYVGNSGYESGYMLIYENVAGVGLNDGLADHAGTFKFVYATNDNMDATPVTELASATLAATGASAGAWTSFNLTINPTAPAGYQLIAKINGYTIYSGAIPSGGPTSGAFQAGFRENHAGGPAANEGTWIDDLSISDVPASVVSQPVSITRLAGQSATFTVIATGTPSLSYQWYKVGTPDQLLSGETSGTYTIPSVALGDDGQYYCHVSNGSSSTDSNAATLTVEEGVTITLQPVTQTIAKGGPVTFTINATGTPSPTYQWYKVGTPDQLLSGETSNSFTIGSVQESDAGQYYCKATNTVNSVDSNKATLMVTPPAEVKDWNLLLDR